MNVLIVEDQVMMRTALRRFLQPAFPRWTLLEAADGASALAACTAHRPELVLMDISLPEVDGIALTRRVKALLPDTHVIFVSYLSGETHVAHALAAGGCAYVVKDRLFSDLIPAIAAAMAAAIAPGHAEGSG